MKDKHVLIHLHTNSMSPASLARAGKAISGTPAWLCTGCSRPKVDVKAVDVVIEGFPPQDPPLNFVYGFSVGLVRRDFLSELGEAEVQRDLYLGSVRLSSGRTLSDWVSFRGRSFVFLRGSKNVACRTCQVCSRPVYFAMGKRYVHPAPPVEIQISESDLSSLVVSSEIAGRINRKAWPNLRIEQLPVLAKPLDGLGVLRTC